MERQGTFAGHPRSSASVVLLPVDKCTSIRTRAHRHPASELKQRVQHCSHDRGDLADGRVDDPGQRHRVGAVVVGVRHARGIRRGHPGRGAASARRDRVRCHRVHCGHARVDQCHGVAASRRGHVHLPRGGDPPGGALPQVPGHHARVHQHVPAHVHSIHAAVCHGLRRALLLEDQESHQHHDDGHDQQPVPNGHAQRQRGPVRFHHAVQHHRRWSGGSGHRESDVWHAHNLCERVFCRAADHATVDDHVRHSILQRVIRPGAELQHHLQLRVDPYWYAAELCRAHRDVD